jgi:hypothetical protein
MNTESCRRKITAAYRGAAIAYYDIAVGLLEVWDNDYAKDWGYRNFQDFVETELDMKYRTGYYYVEIARAVKKFNISKGQVQKLAGRK